MRAKAIPVFLILVFGLSLRWSPTRALPGARNTDAAAQGPSGASSPAVRVSLSASQDNTLYEHPDGLLSNGAGEYFFVGRTLESENSIRRGLIKFDVAGIIPPGSLIVSATLRLTMSKTIAGAQPVALHPLTADWGEGASDALGEEGIGAAATAGDATWIYSFYTTTLWTAPGGDFLGSPSATTMVGDEGEYTWSAPGLVSDVQAWLDAPSTNFGWTLLGNEKSSMTAKRFNTREHSNPATHPVLEITYIPIHAQFLPNIFK